ncbi:phage minor structural protein [Paenibacillus turicensis]|uniref:Phage minor structural protein n=1 Tax=Paenibacillus turicensis TaxID=160487 RepID=A0ABS4FSE5_9BACL|nr:phage tail protein [Paenibacillus turicensis]MBP1905508.1 phage minor structural protein [Paenibacillus turicensis]
MSIDDRLGFLKVFDRSRNPTGLLTQAYDIQRRRRINSDYLLTFQIPMNSTEYRELITIKGHVMDERGQYYVINSRTRKRDGKKLIAEISCSHVMFRLTDYKVPYASYIKELYGAHISQLTDKLTAATNGRFTFVLHDTFDLFDVKDWGRTNCLAALNDMVRMYNVELEPDNFVIHVRKRIGADNGHQYRAAKNVISSSFKDDSSALTTRLFARMKDDRTWIGQPATILTAEERARLEAIPGAIVNGVLQVNYLVSQYAGMWATPDIPFHDNEIIEQNITNVNDLLRQARKALAENEVPALEISVSEADLYKIDEDETRPNLGDTVYCVDPEMEMSNITARITEITEFPYDINKHAQVVVSNVMSRDFADIIADLDRSKRIVHDIMSGGMIRTDVFESFAKQAIADITNSKTEIVWPEEGGLLARDKTNPLRQVRLTSAGLGVSTDGWKTVSAAITPDGVLGPRIIGQIGNFESLSVGSGNNIILLNRTGGLSAGHANFNSAPFRVDHQGNVVMNRLTANSAEIKSSNFTDGSIVGSSINVGNGKFTVSSSGDVSAQGAVLSQGTISGTQIIGGSITSNADINVTRDIRVGNSIYLGLTGQTNDRRIEFVDSGPYRSYIGFTDATKQLEVYGANDVRIRSGLDVTISAMQATLPSYSYLGSASSDSNRIVIRSELESKAAYNMTYDKGTKNLKMWARDGSLLAQVTIS